MAAKRSKIAKLQTGRDFQKSTSSWTRGIFSGLAAVLAAGGTCRLPWCFLSLRPTETAVVLVHRGVSNDPRPPLSRSKRATRRLPGSLGMRQIAKPLRSLGTVELQHRINGFLRVFVQRSGIAMRPLTDLELAFVLLVERRHYGTVGPCFNPRPEHRALIPNQ